jgi:ppGpp synthetase/RelA/SpoT-type nucleotidyltranferase
MSDRGNNRFGYADFGRWYDHYRTTILEPALDRAMHALQNELDDSLSDRDLARIRSISGRVKSKRRTWRKVNQPRYRPQIDTVDDIPKIIDDLVGMRLTCTNLRDLEMVQAALESLPLRASRKRLLGLDPSSERDYVEAPKESGYRGWHVNLGVNLDSTSVTCELQVRTLLQDSWGELTHEDTYSKAGELPPLVEVLSARMADLLATLDDIAEDLRNELDRIDEAIVAENASQADNGDPGDDALASGPGADAADLVLEQTRSRERPIELSALAWALQNEFGAEVSDDWFGFRTFKRFLRHVVPDGEITAGPQAFLLPADPVADPHTDEVLKGDGAPEAAAPAPDTDTDAGADTGSATGFATGSETTDASTSDDGIPHEAHELRRIDRGFPLIQTDQWQRIFDQLAEAWRRNGGSASSTRVLNQITRSARDRAAATGEALSRRHLDYVAKTVFAATGADDPLTAGQVADVFTSSVLQRMAELRIVNAGNAARRTAVARWLLG